MARKVAPKKSQGKCIANPTFSRLTLEDYQSNSIHCPYCGLKSGHASMGKRHGYWTAKCVNGHTFTEGLKAMPSQSQVECAQQLARDHRSKSMAVRYLKVAVGSITVKEAINRGII